MSLSRPFGLSILSLALASCALAYPVPDDIKDQPEVVALYASQTQPVFNEANFDKLALRMEAHYSKNAGEMTTARQAMKKALLADKDFTTLLADYHDLLICYHAMLTTYERDRLEANRKPQSAGAKNKLENIKKARNEVFDLITVNMGSIEARYQAVREGKHF
jgi:hypothetical protein